MLARVSETVAILLGNRVLRALALAAVLRGAALTVFALSGPLGHLRRPDVAAAAFCFIAQAFVRLRERGIVDELDPAIRGSVRRTLDLAPLLWAPMLLLRLLLVPWLGWAGLGEPFGYAACALVLCAAIIGIRTRWSEAESA